MNVLKMLTTVCYLLFAAGALLWIAQIWGSFWTPEVFSKLILSDILIFAILFVLAFLMREHKTHEDRNKLDS